MDFRPADYDEFRYDGWSVTPETGAIELTYSLVGPAIHTFTERVVLPGAVRDTDAITPTARLLWLAAGLSYYKTAAPPTITVTGGLTPAERRFLSEVIAGGLGEFAYRNNLPDALAPTIAAANRPVTAAPPLVDPTAPPLVAVGGGKDSVVTIEALKAASLAPRLFSVNRYAAIDRCVAVADRPYVAPTRTLDPALHELNAGGALNGHVPVTAVTSLIGLLTSHVAGTGPVVFSCEASADNGNLTWAGRVINHQWSKSLAFENLLRATLESSHGLPTPYFSLLRPLTELQIAERFARLPAYFGAFTSCNRSFRLDEARRATHWCGECPKCLFVFLILAPFLTPATLTGIFGRNLLDEPAHASAYAEILGYRGHKPFECVGDYAEARQALGSLAAQPAWRHAHLVATLAPGLADHLDPPAPVGADHLANLDPPYRRALSLS